MMNGNTGARHAGGTPRPANETFSLVVTVDPARFEAEVCSDSFRITVPCDAPVTERRCLRASGEMADALVSATRGTVRRLRINAVASPEDETCLDLVALHSCYEPTRRRVLVFGDSNAWGWDPSSGDGRCRRHGDGIAYSDVVARSLGGGWDVLVDGLANRTTDIDAPADWGCVQSSGFNGAAGLRAAIARCMPLNAVVIQLGTNDLQAVYDRDAYDVARAVKGLVDIVRSAAGGVNTDYPAPMPIVVIPPEIHPPGGTRLGRAFDRAVSKSAALADSYRKAMPDVPMVDAVALLGRLRGSDGLHLTATEHLVLGTAIAEAVRELGRPAAEGAGLFLASEADYGVYLEHLRRLSPELRRMRLCAPLDDEALIAVAAPKAGRTLLLLRENGVVRGVVELHAIDGKAAEIALSLEDEMQGCGHGKEMFQAGMLWARELGFVRLLVVCDAANQKMRRLVAATGAAMTVEDSEAIAWIDLQVVERGRIDTRSRARRDGADGEDESEHSGPVASVAFPGDLATFDGSEATMSGVGQKPTSMGSVTTSA